MATQPRRRSAPASEEHTGSIRPISGRHLAQVLAAEISEAQCDGMSSTWSEWEAALLVAENREEATDAVAEAVALCNHCPAYRPCRDLAELGRYTGIQAGAVYINGRRRPPGARIIQRPEQLAQPAGLSEAG